MFQDAMARMDLRRSEARRQPRSKCSGGLNHEDLAGRMAESEDVSKKA